MLSQNIKDINAVMQPLCQAINNNGLISPHSKDLTINGHYSREDCLTFLFADLSSRNADRLNLVILLAE
jgi:hypothetical protein